MRISDEKLHREFLDSKRPHILMDTHGIHQWQVVPGLPDTGGQNVFINQMTDTLVNLGYRVTIANRGGYHHPTSGVLLEGIEYGDSNRRIIHTEDGTRKFVRKEDMHEHIPKLVDFLFNVLKKENTPIDLIVSHYWDGAKTGIMLNERLPSPVKHMWVPHSVGTVKKRNMPPESWAGLRIEERINVEKDMIPKLDAIAATSSLIHSALADDYGAKKIVFLPPCVNAERFHTRKIAANHPIYDFIAESGDASLSADDVRKARIITEISRTDKTKRKDVLIKAFAKVHKEIPEALLLVSVDKTEAELSKSLFKLIEDLGLSSRVVALGNVWEKLPDIYAVTDVYCSPSVMEGFGMAVQEAAATQVPVVGSHLIPFVCEYLLGKKVDRISYEGQKAAPMKQGEGGIVIEADDVDGFAQAILKLLKDEQLRKKMGERAYHITIPYFTWKAMVERCFEAIGFKPEAG